MSAEREQQDDIVASLRQIAEDDGRYDVQAFQFLFEALSYSQSLFGKDPETDNQEELHVTGQELCQGSRELALERFGYMAKSVFEGWGIFNTNDLGEIVYLLIQNQLMTRRESDSIEDFRRVYDFDTAFEDVFFGERSKSKEAKRRPSN